MICFGYEFDEWPHEPCFERPMRYGQKKYLRAVREGSMTTNAGFLALCYAILEDIGMPRDLNEGSAQVLINWFSKAPARCKREAEREAWRMIA